IVHLSLFIASNSIEDHKTAALQRIARHKRFAQVIQARSVNDNARTANGVDERTSRRIAHDKGFAAFGAVEEGLADIAVNNQFSAVENLAKLVLSVAVYINFSAIQTRGEIIARRAVDVQTKSVGFFVQTARKKTMALAAMDNDVAPA